MYDYSKQTYVEVGDKFETEMPYSEVCMSMRVAGKVMGVALVGSNAHGAVAQLYNPETGHPYSAPILLGEAGVYQKGGRYYYYPPYVEEDSVDRADRDYSEKLGY
jgi:hypothetical protein